MAALFWKSISWEICLLVDTESFPMKGIAGDDDENDEGNDDDDDENDDDDDDDDGKSGDDDDDSDDMVVTPVNTLALMTTTNDYNNGLYRSIQYRAISSIPKDLITLLCCCLGSARVAGLFIGLYE